MFCLFTTIPDDKQSLDKEKLQRNLSKYHKFLTWILVLVWFSLISFAVISIMNPQWLQEWGRQGIDSEFRSNKNFGDSFLYQGEYKSAIANYQRALEIKPNQTGAMINLAVAYMYSNSHKNAAKLLREASKLDSNLKDLILFNIGELMERQGKRDIALEYYKKTVGSIFIDPVLVNRKLGKLYLEAEQYEDALLVFENSLTHQLDINLLYKDMLWRCLDTYSNDTLTLPFIDAQLARGISPELLEPYDLKIIHQQHQTDPEIAKTHNHLAYIQVQIKDYSSARHHYLESHQIWPNNVDAQKGIAFLNQNENTVQQAGK